MYFFLLYKQVMKYTILQKFYVIIIIESCWKLKEGEKLNTDYIVKQGHCDHKIGMWRY